ncbi:MAG: hypothetical protein LUH16_02465 [Clostridiales bacterium]|nr:hypothetical protein [Clostridiales bacterium]
MKRLTVILLTLALLSALMTGCAEEYVTDYVSETDGETVSTAEEAPETETETESESETETPTDETPEESTDGGDETATETDVTAQVEELLSQADFRIETTLNGEDNLYRADWVDTITVYPSAEEDDPEGEDAGTGDSLGTVQIFHYADSQRAAEVAGGFDTADPSLFSMETEEDGEAVAMVVDYVAPIRLYLAEDCIVLYCGDSQGVADTLEGGLGAPFAPADE